MTDRYHSLTVALAKDTRDDDAESLINAIKHLRGVVGVEGNVADASSFAHDMRAQTHLAQLASGLTQAIVRGGVEEVVRVLQSVKSRSVL